MFLSFVNSTITGVNRLCTAIVWYNSRYAVVSRYFEEFLLAATPQGANY
jgi:hypothetical protein